MSRINDLVRCAIAMLAPATGAKGGAASAAVLADHKFNRVAMGERGPYGLPLLGVAYAGSQKGRCIDVGRQIYEADQKLVVFVVYRDLTDLDTSLTGHYDLVDRVVDLLAGRVPVLTNTAGVPLAKNESPYAVDADQNLLDDKGALVKFAGVPVWMFDLPDLADSYIALGDPLIWTGDGPIELPQGARQAGLSCWVVQFTTHGTYTPERADRTRTPLLAGVDLTTTIPADDVDPEMDLLALVAEFEEGD